MVSKVNPNNGAINEKNVFEYMTKTTRVRISKRKSRTERYFLYKCFFCKYENRRYEIKMHLLNNWKKNDPIHIVKSSRRIKKRTNIQREQPHLRKSQNSNIDMYSGNKMKTHSMDEEHCSKDECSRKLKNRNRNRKRNLATERFYETYVQYMAETSKSVTYNSHTFTLYKCSFCTYEGPKFYLKRHLVKSWAKNDPLHRRSMNEGTKSKHRGLETVDAYYDPNLDKVIRLMQAEVKLHKVQITQGKLGKIVSHNGNKSADLNLTGKLIL